MIFFSFCHDYDTEYFALYAYCLSYLGQTNLKVKLVEIHELSHEHTKSSSNTKFNFLIQSTHLYKGNLLPTLKPYLNSVVKIRHLCDGG